MQEGETQYLRSEDLYDVKGRKGGGDKARGNLRKELKWEMET